VKILIYTEDFAPSIGGVQAITSALAQGLAEWYSSTNGRAVKANTVTVVTRTPADGVEDARFPFRIARQPRFLRLYQLIRESDVVHVSGPSILPMACAIFLGKPVAVEHHGYQAVCPSGIYLHQPDSAPCPGHFCEGHYRECFRCQSVETTWWRGIRNILLLFPRRWLVRRVNANVIPSDYTAVRIGLPHMHTIYHGIEDPLEVLPSPRVGRPICFAYLGRLVPEKGVELLIRAARKVKGNGGDFCMKIIGDGPERGRLERLTAESGLENIVKFLGYRRGDALLEALKDVSVSIVPSRWEEVAGLAAIEPMMRGILVIAADIGGLGEMVGDTAIKFPAGDVDALAASITRVLDDPQLIRSLGETARGRALNIFNREQMMRRHLELYGQVVRTVGAPQ
jgi:glycogen synthase